MNLDDFNASVNEEQKKKQDQQTEKVRLDTVNQSGDKVVTAVDQGTKTVTAALKNVGGSVEVTNTDLAKSQDVSQAVEAINKLNLTTFMQNEGLPQLAQNLNDLSGKTQDLQDKLENEGLRKMSDQLGMVVKKLDEVSKTLSKTEVSVDAKLQKTIDNLSKSIGSIDFNPSVNISAPEPKVVTTPINLDTVVKALGSVEKAIKDSETPETEIDLSSVTSGLSAVQKAIQALRFPVPNYVLPFKDQSGKAVQAQLNDDGTLGLGAEAAPSNLVSFITTVTTAGTRVQLASNVAHGFILEAPSTNTGLIYVGGSTVSSTVYGAELQAGQSTSVALSNTNKIYIDASVNGDKCSVLGS